MSGNAIFLISTLLIMLVGGIYFGRQKDDVMPLLLLMMFTTAGTGYVIGYAIRTAREII